MEISDFIAEFQVISDKYVKNTEELISLINSHKQILLENGKSMLISKSRSHQHK